MKKLHDLLILKVTQSDKETQKAPLVHIVRTVVKKFELEFPVDKGWIDIYVPVQKNIKHQYVIEVETGYDFNCSGIFQKFERFRKALTIRKPHVGVSGKYLIAGSKTIYPKSCVVIPKDFAEFIPLFKVKEISVFIWEGKLEWKCKKCGKTTLGETPWKPSACKDNSCKGREKSLRLVGLRDFQIKEAYRVP